MQMNFCILIKENIFEAYFIVSLKSQQSKAVLPGIFRFEVKG